MQISVQLSESKAETKSKRKIERATKIRETEIVDATVEVHVDNNTVDNNVVDNAGYPSLDTIDGMDSFLTKQEEIERRKALRRERKLSKKKSSEESIRFEILRTILVYHGPN